MYSTPRSPSACSGRSPGRIVPFRPDGAVELVFDLQQGGAELPVVVAVADADGRVRRIGLGERAIERAGVAFEAVVAHRQRGLRIALVAQRAHAQRGAVRKIQGARFQLLQPVRAAGDEGRAHRGRRSEQIKQQPGMTPEVADQREVRVVLIVLQRAAARVDLLQHRPGALRHRKVVVDAGNGLHAPAVAMREALAVHGLGFADVGAAVLTEGNVVIGGQSAGHAGAPQHLVADVPVDDLMDRGEFIEARVHAGVDAGDQLELGFAEIRGDVRMGERRAERRRVRRIGKRAVRPDAKAFLFDSAPDAPEYFRRECAQPFVQRISCGSSIDVVHTVFRWWKLNIATSR